MKINDKIKIRSIFCTSTIYQTISFFRFTHVPCFLPFYTTTALPSYLYITQPFSIRYYCWISSNDEQIFQLFVMSIPQCHVFIDIQYVRAFLYGTYCNLTVLIYLCTMLCQVSIPSTTIPRLITHTKRGRDCRS